MLWPFGLKSLTSVYHLHQTTRKTVPITRHTVRRQSNHLFGHVYFFRSPHHLCPVLCTPPYYKRTSSNNKTTHQPISHPTQPSKYNQFPPPPPPPPPDNDGSAAAGLAAAAAPPRPRWRLRRMRTPIVPKQMSAPTCFDSLVGVWRFVGHWVSVGWVGGDTEGDRRGCQLLKMACV